MRPNHAFFRPVFSLVALALASAAGTARAQIILDVSTTGATASGVGQIGGGFTVSQAFLGGAGSGAIDAFLRAQNNGGEQSYNTDAGLPFDGKNSPGGLSTLFLSAVPIVRIGGLDFREFVLDINQSGNGNISLNQLQLFQSSIDPGMGGTATAASATADPVLSFSSGSINEIFRLNNAQNNGSNLATNYEIIGGSGTGSGSIDMAFYVLNSKFAQDDLSRITLFSQFGSPNGSLDANAGFEEWAVRVGVAHPPAVPEPSPIVHSALLGVIVLGRFGWRAIRRRFAA